MLGGMALCVFHDDHHPSLRGKGTRWRCWACGAGDYVEAGKSGSIIDLGARLSGRIRRRAWTEVSDAGSPALTSAGS